MFLSEPSGPDLIGVVRAANAVKLRYVVIGSFGVIAHGYLRATKDSDLLVPAVTECDSVVAMFLDRVQASRLRDGEVLAPEERAADLIRVRTRHGIVELLRGGLAPLDFDTVAEESIEVEIGDQKARVASLRSIVGFKRFADRLRDRVDLEALERVNGRLPETKLPVP